MSLTQKTRRKQLKTPIYTVFLYDIIVYILGIYYFFIYGGCSHSLDTIGTELKELFAKTGAADYSGDRTQEIYDFLSSAKKNAIASSGKTCLNIFCI